MDTECETMISFESVVWPFRGACNLTVAALVAGKAQKEDFTRPQCAGVRGRRD